MNTSKGRVQSAHEPRYQERPTAADSAVGTTETVTDSASVQHEPDPPYGSEAYLFRELMAIMHDDGGHYHAQHGAQKAYEDACTKYWRLVVTAENTAKDVRATDEAGVTTDRESESP